MEKKTRTDAALGGVQHKAKKSSPKKKSGADTNTYCVDNHSVKEGQK